MWNAPQPTTEEVEHLLANAQLRDALEPFCDEAISLIDTARMPTSEENKFLASMLAWECAPVLPVSQWFQPELKLPPATSLDDKTLHELLWGAIARLYEAHIVLDLTDHLSDRQLYCLLCRDILSAAEKKVDGRRNYLHWRCLDEDDEETFLRYYASREERRRWSAETGRKPPPSSPPPFPRQLPREPQA